VAVLPDLGDQERGRAAFGILERIDQRLHFFDSVGHGGRLPLVDAGDGSDLGTMPPEHLFHGIRISPTVSLGARASIAKRQQIAVPSPALRVSAANASSTSFWLRSFFSRDSLSICSRRTVIFRPSGTSIGASSIGL